MVVKMSNKILFSHSYLKLPPHWEGKKATLLFVREIELGEQTMWFKDYDTKYMLDSLNFEYYDLPDKGKYLLLLFECEGTVFTTLRRSTPQKKVYYELRRMQEFELVKTEEAKP
jgi:hypothetical protein